MPVIVIKQNFKLIKSIRGINKNITLFSPCYSHLLLALCIIFMVLIKFLFIVDHLQEGQFDIRVCWILVTDRKRTLNFKACSTMAGRFYNCIGNSTNNGSSPSGNNPHYLALPLAVFKIFKKCIRSMLLHIPSILKGRYVWIYAG